MRDRIAWTQGASVDLQELYSSFEEEVAERFLTQLDAALSLLSVFPEQASVYSGNVRRLLIGKRRQYGLFYSVVGRRIIISALADLRQDPDKIAEILRQRSAI